MNLRELSRADVLKIMNDQNYVAFEEFKHSVCQFNRVHYRTQPKIDYDRDHYDRVIEYFEEFEALKSMNS